jgi:hypothetical protein
MTGEDRSMFVAVGEYTLAIVCCTLLLYLLHECIRRYLKLTTAFFLLALLSLPLWSDELNGWFLWLKTALMIISVLIISLARLGHATTGHRLTFLKRSIFLWMIYVALITNIAVALVPDLEIENYFNALTGLLLCILVPLPTDGWRIDTHRYGRNDLLVDLPVLWCLLYGTWWLNFLYDGWPNILGRGVCLIAVTLIPIAIYRRGDLWLSVRAYTLALYMLSIALCDYTVPVLDVAVKSDRQFETMWGIINFILSATYAFWWFAGGRKRFRGRYSTAGS